MERKLQQLRQDIGREHLNTNLSPIINVKYEDVKWLIEQAELLEKIKRLSHIENLTVGEFASGVLLLIDNKEIPTRKERS